MAMGIAYKKSDAKRVDDKWESASVLRELKRKDRVKVCRREPDGALVPLVVVELMGGRRGDERAKAEDKRRWLAETNPGVEYVLDPPAPAGTT
jgi:hypothetical protein